MADAKESWIGLKYVEELDSEAVRLKFVRDARVENWMRGIMAVGWSGLAIGGLVRPEPRDEFLVYALLPLMAFVGTLLFLLRRKQLASTIHAKSYTKRGVLASNNLTVSIEGDDGTVVGTPDVYYWAYAKTVVVAENGIDVTFGDGRKVKTVSVPSAVFPNAETMEGFRVFVKGEAARRGLTPKEHWLRPPG